MRGLVVLLVAIGVLALTACNGSQPEPTPDIEATVSFAVEATLAAENALDATVETRVAATVAAPVPVSTVAPSPAATPTPTSTPRRLKIEGLELDARVLGGETPVGELFSGPCQALVSCFTCLGGPDTGAPALPVLSVQPTCSCRDFQNVSPRQARRPRTGTRGGGCSHHQDLIHVVGQNPPAHPVVFGRPWQSPDAAPRG